jgi:hypothetical protein
MEFEPQYFVSSVTLANALAEGASGVRWGVRSRAKMLASLFHQRHLPAYSSFNQSRWLQHEAAGLLGKAAYFHNVCGYIEETESLHGLWQIAINCGAMMPHERVCWLSERHDTLSYDISGHLHNAKSPAVRYPDGWSLYAWKGVVVPSWIIEHPDCVERIHIDRERNSIIRRCMIDIMTPQRYVATGAATRFAVDQSGVLWRKQWRDWSDAWAAVEVINGTPEPDGSRTHYFLQVPPEMRTPTEAVAWTYGMTANRYAALTLRT